MLKGSPKASTHKWGVFFVHPSREADCPRNLGQKSTPSEMGWCTWLNKPVLWRLTEKDPMSVNFFVKIMRFPVSLGVLWVLCFVNFSFRAPHGKTTNTIQVQQDAAETSAKTRSSKHRCISPHRLRRFPWASSNGPETGSPLMFPQTSRLGVNVEQIFRLPKKVPKSQHSTSLRGLGTIHGNAMHVVFLFRIWMVLNDVKCNSLSKKPAWILRAEFMYFGWQYRCKGTQYWLNGMWGREVAVRLRRWLLMNSLLQTYSSLSMLIRQEHATCPSDEKACNSLWFNMK